MALAIFIEWNFATKDLWLRKIGYTPYKAPPYQPQWCKCFAKNPAQSVFDGV